MQSAFFEKDQKLLHKSVTNEHCGKRQNGTCHHIMLPHRRKIHHCHGCGGKRHCIIIIGVVAQAVQRPVLLMMHDDANNGCR